MPYGTLALGQSHWAARSYSGVLTLQLLNLATVFVDGVGWRMTSAGVPVTRFSGAPTSADQEFQWPRTGAVDVYGREIPVDEIPLAVQRATYEAAWYAHENDGGLNIALRSDQHLAREQFGDVSFSYFVAGRTPPSAGMAPTATYIPAVMTELAPLLTDGANPYGITGVVA